MKKSALLFVFILMISIAGNIRGQGIRIYETYDEFEPLLQNKNDTTYVFNFWATWCGPCVKELPDFMEANEKFKDRKFKMILVSLDFETHLETKVKPFLKEKQIDAEVVLLTDSKQHVWIDQVNKEWSGSIPVTIIYNKDFYFFREGSLDFDELNEIITKNIIQ